MLFFIGVHLGNYNLEFTWMIPFTVVVSAIILDLITNMKVNDGKNGVPQ